jgi:xanthine dehydrogenase large subunit
MSAPTPSPISSAPTRDSASALAPPAPGVTAQLSQVVGRSLPHESAHLHVAGTAAYTDDLPEPAGTLHAALGLSPVAHGRLLGVDSAALMAEPGVVAVLTAADIPGTNDCGAIVHDDPVLADGTLHYLGQPVFVVLARTRDLARRAAAKARQVMQIEPLPAVLSPRQAHAQGQHVVPSMHLARESTAGGTRRALNAAPHRLSGTFRLGGQEQFYLEGQIATAVPLEDGAMAVHCSTQHPSEMQHVVGRVLGVAAHRVQVTCRRMGGGFGGKESQSALPAAVAALAARATGRPVKLRYDRDDDFMITGRRHGFEFDWEAGFDDTGRLLGVELTMIANAGFSTDLSPPVLTRAICHADNAYWLPEVSVHGHLARTNTQSNTAFRGFGGPQGAFAIEVVIDEVARHLGLDALAVRQANLYGVDQRNVTPYGQTVNDNVISSLTEELVRTSGYAQRRTEVDRFNASSPVLKKGLALMPVKFGISFNLPHLNQAGALVHVYTDGSVLVNHGGTEMGQGLNTKVAQVVAHELGLPLERVRCSATDTSKVANTSATAASTGSDLNGKAAQDAARQIGMRLAGFWLSTLPAAAVGGDDAARAALAREVRFANGQLQWGRHRAPFDEVVTAAYEARVQLWSDGFYTTPGLSWNRETLTGSPFFYFAYGAAVSEVVIDTLTGETRLLRADLLHDAGRSLNPALDIGQVEGAYVQGLGWLTSEELLWHSETGRLLTHAPSTYKIPTANDVPAAFHTALFDNANVQDSIHRSKAVGEPPILLPFSAFLAIRDAISAAGGHRVQPPLDAPATPEAVLRAVAAVRQAGAQTPVGAAAAAG